MPDDGPPAANPSNEPVYCRFAKRNLNSTSWLAPLINNRIGDLLNLELRHEQLFFILTCAGLIALHWPASGNAPLGLWVGVALIAGGWSTIWLSWMTRREDASPLFQPE